MGTSMKEPVQASSSRKARKNKFNFQSSKRHVSLTPNYQYKVFIHKPRPVSQISRLESNCQPFVISKQQRVHKHEEQEDTPVFKPAYHDKYLELDLTNKTGKNINKSKEIEGIIYEASQPEDNHFCLPSTLSGKNSFGQMQNESIIRVQDELDLCIDSKIQKVNEQLFLQFSPVINSNTIEYGERRKNTGEKKQNRKENILLQRMIKQHKRPENLLQKYIPKSKKPSKKVHHHKVTDSEGQKINKMSYQEGNEYFQVQNPEQHLGKSVEKQYVIWKKRESSGKKQNFKKAPKDSKASKKQSDPSQYYQLSSKHAHFPRIQSDINNQKKVKLSELARQRRRQRSSKLFKSSQDSRMSFTSIRSQESTRKTTMHVIHF